MVLTLTEAATVLGRSPRTVRAQLASGRLRGYKRDGRWVVPRDALPLTEAQRRALQRKAAALRDAVEEALPEAVRGRRKGLRLADVPAFAALAGLTNALRGDAGVPAAVLEPLEDALEALAEGHCEFDVRLKGTALRRARARLAHALAHAALQPDCDEVREAADAVEEEVLPRLAGMLRRLDQLPGGAA